MKRRKRGIVNEKEDIEYLSDPNLVRSRILNELNIDLPAPPEKTKAVHNINDLL